MIIASRTQFHVERPCLNSVLNVKALVGAFNQEKALVGAFSVIVQLHGLIDCGTRLDTGWAETLTESVVLRNLAGVCWWKFMNI